MGLVPEGGSQQIELHCRIEGAMLKPVREFVGTVARQMGFSEQQANEIEVCVDEACANALEHAYPQSIEREFALGDRVLKLELSFENDEFIVRVADFGCGSEKPIEPAIHSVEEYLQSDSKIFRGLGLFLMNKYMDRVELESVAGKGTVVKMIKKRKV